MSSSDPPRPSPLRASILAPSKFRTGDGSSSSSSSAPPVQFPGFKESKLSSLPQLSSTSTSSPDPTASASATATATLKNPFNSFLPLKTKNGEEPEKKDAATAVVQGEQKNGNNSENKTQNDSSKISNPFASSTSASIGKQDSGGNSFVFGQNLSDRAANIATEKLEARETSSATFGDKKLPEKEASPPSATVEAASASSAVASSSAAAVDEAKTSSSGEGEPRASDLDSQDSSKDPAASVGADEGRDHAASDPQQPKPSKTLTESAAEYIESHAQKRKYEEIETVTGEEDERNVYKMNAKLYVFDKVATHWQERGRGSLRLNDSVVEEEKQSRLVMRTGGSLRVILNTKLYPGMTMENPTEKNIRLTGYDDCGQVKVFLISGSAKDIASLFSALKERQKKLHSKNGAGATVETNKDDDDESSAKKSKNNSS